MLKARTLADKGPQKRNPNLFIAAQDDDLDHLAEGFSAGKRLDEQHPYSGFTPLHVAALHGSAGFIAAAIEHPSANVWLRDYEGRLAIDHSDARREYDVSRLFYQAMYPGGAVPLVEPD